MFSLYGGIFCAWLYGDDPIRFDNWLNNAIALSEWLNCPVHFGVPSFLIERLQEVERRLQSLSSPSTVRAIGHDHQVAERDIISAVETTSSALLLLPLPSEASAETTLGDWHLLPKNSPVPTAFFPTERRLGQPPFSNIIIPVSGELKENLALRVGLELANDKGIPVDLIHITPDWAAGSCKVSPLECIGDEVQHEYSERIDHLISKGSPFSSLREKRRIREFRHSFGEIATELKKMLNENPSSLLLVDWSGTLDKGHAETIKDVLTHTSACSVLVKSPPQARAHLNIGRDFLKQVRSSGLSPRA